MAEKIIKLRKKMFETEDVPIRFVIRNRAAEIEELKSEGCSYQKIYDLMVELKILKCSYSAFVANVQKLKKEANPKKEVLEKQNDWGAEKPTEYNLYGDD